MKTDTTLRESIQNGLKGFLVAFATMTLVLAIIGYFVPIEDGTHGTFFGAEGLSYQSILQIGLCCLVLGAWRVFFMGPLLFKSLLLLWRVALMCTCMLLSTVGFIIGFGWFPANSWEGWLGFITGLVGGSAVVVFLLWRKTRRETREYEDLLQQYKKQKKN